MLPYGADFLMRSCNFYRDKDIIVEVMQQQGIFSLMNSPGN
jgi:hypothetical protein